MKDAKETRQALEDGTVDIVIGTHALLAESIRFSFGRNSPGKTTLPSLFMRSSSSYCVVWRVAISTIG